MLITSMTIQSHNEANVEVKIRKNDSLSDVASITLNNEVGKSEDNLDIELNTNDWIQAYLQINSNNIDYPVLLVEIAWID